MSIKIPIKISGYDNIIYTDGYIVLNSCCIIKANLCALDFGFLRKKVEDDEAFNYYVEEGTFGAIPDVRAVMPIYDKDMETLTNTNFLYEGENEQYKVYRNTSKNRYYVFLNTKYTNLLEQIIASYPYVLRQTKKSDGACIFNDYNELLFLLMPVTINSAEKYLDKGV